MSAIKRGRSHIRRYTAEFNSTPPTVSATQGHLPPAISAICCCRCCCTYCHALYPTIPVRSVLAFIPSYVPGAETCSALPLYSIHARPPREIISYPNNISVSLTTRTKVPGSLLVRLATARVPFSRDFQTCVCRPRPSSSK